MNQREPDFYGPARRSFAKRRHAKSLAMIVLASGPCLAADAPAGFTKEVERITNIRGSSVDQSQDGWIIVDSPAENTRYFITSDADAPAFPSIFERVVYEENGAVRIRTNVQCGSTRKACDNILEQFADQDRSMKEAFSNE